MNVTTGLLLIFLNVFLPGLIFLRFYYTGEFSKQFSTKVPIIRLGFLALIPGLIFLISAVLIYNGNVENFTAFNAITIFSELLGRPKDYSCITKCFLKNHIDIYSWFTLFLNFGAFVSAIFAHWIVRKMQWDIQFKLLRFKNQWYYVFNGSILKYKKYKALSFVNPDEKNNREIMMAAADILVNESGNSKLYSGIVMDYDLDQNDLNSLDKIYLIDAHRYKKNIHVNGSLTVDKRKIPGQIFVILNSNILNINLTYVPSPINEIKKTIYKEKNKKRIKTFKLLIDSIRLPLVIYIGLILSSSDSKIKAVNFFQNEFNMFQKTLLILTILTLISVISFEEIPKTTQDTSEDEKKEIENENRVYKVLLIGLFIFLIINLVTIFYEVFF